MIIVLQVAILRKTIWFWDDFENQILAGAHVHKTDTYQNSTSLNEPCGKCAVWNSTTVIVLPPGYVP